MFCRSNGAARRRVDDGNPLLRSFLQVDVVHADAGATDNLQSVARGDDLGSYLRGTAHYERLIVTNHQG